MALNTKQINVLLQNQLDLIQSLQTKLKGAKSTDEITDLSEAISNLESGFLDLASMADVEEVERS